jgi:hypothetical protein
MYKHYFSWICALNGYGTLKLKYSVSAAGSVSDLTQKQEGNACSFGSDGFRGLEQLCPSGRTDYNTDS